MAVAFDAASTIQAWTTTPDPFTFSHTPSGTPKGIIVFVIHVANADAIGTVTYGGVTMTAVSGGVAIDTATEFRVAKAYFLGASIPTGTQTVSIDHNADANDKKAVCISLTASGDTETVGTPALLQENGTIAEQNVDSGADSALRFAAAALGHPTADVSIGANSTEIARDGTSVRTYAFARETTGGSGSRSIGWSSATSDDRAIVHIAVKESAANVTVTPTTAALVLTTFVPTVTTTGSVTVTPTTATLNLSTFAPTVTATGAGYAHTFVVIVG